MGEERFVMIGDTRVPIADGIDLGEAAGFEEPPMEGAELALFLRAALGERIATGSWGVRDE